MVSLSKTRAGKERSGAAVVELALTLPIIVALLIAIIEIGQSLRAAAVLAEAANNACAAGSRPGYANANILYEVQTALTNAGLPANTATVDILVNDVAGVDVSTAQRNDKISVTISIPWSALSLTHSNCFFPSNSKLSDTATMLKQG